VKWNFNFWHNLFALEKNFLGEGVAKFLEALDEEYFAGI